MKSQLEIQNEVLVDIEPIVAEFMERHIEKTQMWYASDIIPYSDSPETDKEILEMRKRAKNLPENVKVSIALNMLTEEGLPHYHRLLYSSFSGESVWKKWSYLWTAEEDRHGNVLRDYCRETRIFNFNELEKYQFEYLSRGMNPAWAGHPYKTLVYTSAQERATQVSHESTAQLAKEIDPTITLILKRLATEEARHFYFYMNSFREILVRDTNFALKCAHDVLSKFSMPGVEIRNFGEIAEVIMRSGIYSLDDYKTILEQLISQWKVEVLTGLNELGRIAQDKIMELPRKTEKLSHYIKTRFGQKSFSFDFLYERKFSI